MNVLRLAFFICFISTLARADEGRYRTRFVSPNGQYELRLTDTQSQTIKDSIEGDYQLVLSNTWGLFQKAARIPLYSLKGFFGSKTVYVADNGLHLTVVDDFSDTAPADSVEVISFYRQGIKVGGYRLGQVLCSSYNIEESVSHFQWFDGRNIRITSQALTIKTFELTTLTFDIDSGSLISKKYSLLLTKTALFVAGDVTRIGPGKYELVVAQRVHGRVPENGRIRFTSKQNLFSYVTVLIDNGQYKNVEHISDWYLNQGSYKLEQMRDKQPQDADFVKRRLGVACP